MSDLPHVMRDIVSPLVLGNEDKFWLKSKYLRRGRLVEAAVTLLAKGQKIPDDWWLRHSGESDDDRVEHEECRPYVDGGRKFLAEVPCQIVDSQHEVISRNYDYQGHIDWYALLHQARVPYVIDLKCGPPPPDKILIQDEDGTTLSLSNPLDVAYRMQLALYAIGLGEETKKPASAYRRADLHLFDGKYAFVERNGAADIRSALVLLGYYSLARQWSKP